MSSNSDQNRVQTPFEMVKSAIDQEHPADVIVASRLPQTELKARISELSDEIKIALSERQALWGDIEELLNERDIARTEAYFNLGYEYGLATGRTEAFAALSDNTDLETQEFAERVRNLVASTGLPASRIFAVLLETSWVFAHDIHAANQANNDA